MFKLVVLFAFVAVASAGYAPLAYTHYAAPAVSVPTAVSHQSRTDVISKPIVATYAAAPVATYAAAPVATYAAAPVATYAAAPVATYAAAPVATYAAAPVAAHVAYSAPAVAVPTAVSHQSRTDVISKPVVAAYSAPVAGYGYGYAAAPLGYDYGYGYAGKLAYGHY